MELPAKVLEKINILARDIEHGSIEVVLDSTKAYIDVIGHNRERVEVEKKKNV